MSLLFVNFEHISHLVPVFLLLTLSRLMPAGITLSIGAKYFVKTSTFSFPMHPFFTPWKHRKTVRFCFVFSGSREWLLGNKWVKWKNVTPHMSRHLKDLNASINIMKPLSKLYTTVSKITKWKKWKALKISSTI